ncbi:hypothetical protein ACF07W_27025 [Streptomyces sp. NPDC015140]|uniref:hypothetical protein n=1 Tax=Streptomyces sp. NPDC015140 TaxID=3364943 RepID=UPI0036FB1D43
MTWAVGYGYELRRIDLTPLDSRHSRKRDGRSPCAGHFGGVVDRWGNGRSVWDTGPGGTYARLVELGHEPVHFRVLEYDFDA